MLWPTHYFSCRPTSVCVRTWDTRPPPGQLPCQLGNRQHRSSSGRFAVSFSGHLANMSTGPPGPFRSTTPSPYRVSRYQCQVVQAEGPAQCHRGRGTERMGDSASSRSVACSRASRQDEIDHTHRLGLFGAASPFLRRSTIGALDLHYPNDNLRPTQIFGSRGPGILRCL